MRFFTVLLSGHVYSRALCLRTHRKLRILSAFNFFPEIVYNRLDIGHCVRPVVAKCSNPSPVLRPSQSSLVTLLFVCSCACQSINSNWRCHNHGSNQAVMSVVTRDTILLGATPAARPITSPSQTQSLFLLAMLQCCNVAMYPPKNVYARLIPSLITLLPSANLIDVC